MNFLADESLPRGAMKEINEYLFKTPLDVVISSSKPEKSFIESLCKEENSCHIECWVKSRDRGFYSIEYSMKYGSKGSKTRKYALKSFNPDFFIKLVRDEMEYCLVVEIKDDKDDSEENKAKYKYAKEHFENQNNELRKANIKQKYLFHFLSPNGYTEFFQYMKNGTLFESQRPFQM